MADGNNDKDANSAEDQRDNNADTAEAPKHVNVKIRNTTKAGTGIAIVGGVHLPEQKKPN